jgi:hypothetical protein
VSVFCLGSDQIDECWDEIAPHLYRLERLGQVSVDETRDDLKTQRKQLWGYQDGAILGICVTRITKDGTCEIYGAAGTAGKERILEVHAAIERWAKSINCTKLRLQGRKGWFRLLKGYEQTGVILEKEIL